MASMMVSLSSSSTAGTPSWGHPGTPHLGDILGRRSLEDTRPWHPGAIPLQRAVPQGHATSMVPSHITGGHWGLVSLKDTWPRTPEGVPTWEQSSPEDTCSPGIPTSLSHSCEAVVAGDSFMFFSPHSRHSGDQRDPPGEEFPGFRALPRGRSQAGLHHVLHHPLWDGLQAADAQCGRCVGPHPVPCVHPWDPTPFPASQCCHPNLILNLFLQQLSARRTSTYG